MTRVLVVDDHAVVRHGLVRLLEAEEGLTVVGSAADGREAVDCCETLEPDVIVMDISMPVMDGVEATRRIVEATDERVQVVILTTFAEDERVRAAIDAGAVGYILKDADPEAIVAAVHSAAAGGAPLDPRVARALLRRTEAPAGPTLSAREREVLQLIGAGLPNKVIAIRLGISEGTVKTHLTRIYQAIGVTDRTQAALWVRANA